MSPGRVTVPKVVELVERPWGSGLATANGVQYTASENGSNSGTWYYIGLRTFNAIPYTYNGGMGSLKEVDSGVTVAFKIDNGDAQITWLLQGRQIENPVVARAVNWVDLSDSLTQARPCNTIFYDNSLAGKLAVGTNFAQFPFELRVAFQSNTDNIVQGRLKSSSYARYLYTVTSSA